MPVEPQAPYISSKDAAKKYGLTNDHIGLLCRRGKIQGLLWGRVWYISEPSIEDYVKKNAELMEARKQQLSQQWRAAWTVAFIGFSLFTYIPQDLHADYVSLPAQMPAPEPLSLSLRAAAGELGEIKNAIPVAAVPTVVPLNQPGTPAQPFGTLVALGFEQLGEFVYRLAMPAADTEVVRIVYAKDFFVGEEVQYPAEPLSDFLAAAAGKAGEAVSALAIPEFTLAAVPDVPVLINGKNISAGVVELDESLAVFNDAMFATYLWSLQQFGAAALFDAKVAAHIWDHTFAALGEQFVSDMHNLGRAQAAWYVSMADALATYYNELADATGDDSTFDRSISVASIAYSPDIRAAVGESSALNWWSGAVEFVSNIFANKLNPSVSAGTGAIASSEPAQNPLTSEPKQPDFASVTTPVVVPTFAQADSTLQEAGSTLLQSAYLPEPTTLSDYVTQTSLNQELSAWMQVVRALIAGTANRTGYVDNPAAAAIGAGGGSTVVNNYFAAAQRIDKLDGVVITNSSINGVSDFSSLGVSDGIGSWFSPALYGNSTSTILGFEAGFLAVGSSTITGDLSISGGATTTSFAVLNLTDDSCDVKATSGGIIYCGTDSTSTGQANPFSYATNFGTLTAATSSALWARAGIFASSTSWIASTTFALNGNVGISTSTPGAKFAVNGNTLISGNFITTGSLTAYASSTIGSGIQAGGLNIFGGATTTGTAYFANNIGVGVQVPTRALHVDQTNASGDIGITLRNSTSNVNSSASIAFQVNVGAAADSAQIKAIRTNLPVSADSDLAFFTRGNGTTASEKLRLTSVGKLGIGTTSPWGKFSITNTTNDTAGQPLLVVASSTQSATTTQFIITNAGKVGIGVTDPQASLSVALVTTPATGARLHSDSTSQTAGMAIAGSATSNRTAIAFENPNGVVGSIVSNGSATSYNTSSDRRIKENITDSSRGLETLLKLSVRDYSFIKDSTHATTTGFIAQELFEVFPDAVTTNGDNGIDVLGATSTPWSIDYGRLTPLIVKAVQEIYAQVVVLGEKLAALVQNDEDQDTRIQALEDRIRSLETQLGAAAAASTPTPVPEEPVPEATSTTSTEVPDASASSTAPVVEEEAAEPEEGVVEEPAPPAEVELPPAPETPTEPEE